MASILHAPGTIGPRQIPRWITSHATRCIAPIPDCVLSTVNMLRDLPGSLAPGANNNFSLCTLSLSEKIRAPLVGSSLRTYVTFLLWICSRDRWCVHRWCRDVPRERMSILCRSNRGLPRAGMLASPSCACRSADLARRSSGGEGRL